MPDSWDERVEAVWNDDALSDVERIERIDALAAERAEDDPAALFERAGPATRRASKSRRRSCTYAPWPAVWTTTGGSRRSSNSRARSATSAA